MKSQPPPEVEMTEEERAALKMAVAENVEAHGRVVANLRERKLKRSGAPPKPPPPERP